MGEEFFRLTIEQYKIYKRDGYYLCISNLDCDNYQLFIGFTDKDFNSLTKEQIVSEIRKVSDLVKSINQSGIYVLPVISPSELEQAARENDDKLFYRIMSEKIQPITREIYEILNGQNKSIESMIRMIKQTDNDRKFIDWMDMKLMETGIDYVEDIEYLKLREMAQNKNIETSTDVYGGARNNSSGIPPIDRSYENTQVQTNSNQLVRKLVKPTNQHISSGFSNIGFIVIVLTMALIVGIWISYLFIK